jgi:hypothetical protein
MKFEDKYVYNKPAATVIKMFTDRKYFEDKYAQTGAKDVEVLEHEKSDKKFRIKCRFKMKNDAPLPDLLKKIMGEYNTITQEDVWDITARTGKLNIEIKGAPLKVSADMTLRDEGGKGANIVKWNISASIPFIGGKLENFIAEDIKSKAKPDLAVSNKLLAAY